MATVESVCALPTLVTVNNCPTLEVSLQYVQHCISAAVQSGTIDITPSAGLTCTNNRTENVQIYGNSLSVLFDE